MKKETQTQIMKPIKVLSLVLLALLLLVPAASAETYTLIDEDLEFGGESGGSVGSISGVSSPLSSEVYSSPSTIPPANLNSGQLRVYLWDEYCSTHDNFILSVVLEDGSFLSVELPIDEEHLLQNPTSDYSVYSYRYVDYFPVPTYSSGILFVGDVLYSNGDVASELLDNFAYDSENIGYCRYFWLYPNSENDFSRPSGIQNIIVSPSDSLVAPSTQHVTVTYSDESEKYTVTLERNGVLSSGAVVGKVFGWLPVVHHVDTSSEDWTVTLSPYFLWFEVDYELRVNLDGQTDSVSWNLDTLPITVPPPDPPLPEDPPEEPDEPFKPDEPFPEFDPPPPNLLPERIPTSIKDLIGFSKEEILASFAAGIPFYSDALYVAADLFDFIFENVLGVVIVVLGFFFDPIYQMFNYLYELVTWILSSFISFGQYFEIPNHILSRLVQILPNSIVNFALVVFGFDIFLNILSIAVSDLIIAYRSTVYTYYHKVEHPKPKGGKK